ncbi:MAG: M67 family metallopeptidase [Clostridia bacterium]|nr:M67 family metallopeptidase [Clostridia bacterium]
MEEKTIRISRAGYQTILKSAKTAFPEEACGLIAGSVTDEMIEIRKVYTLENTDHSTEHFSLDPKEQLLAVRDMRKNGLTPLGNWHSHPATPSRPSEEDKRLSYDRNAVYMILSLAGEKPVLNAFHIEGTEVRKENLVITGE